MPCALRLVLLPLLAAIARQTRGWKGHRPGDGELPIEERPIFDRAGSVERLDSDAAIGEWRWC